MTTRVLTLGVALLCATALLAQKQQPPAPATPRDFAIPTVRRLELPNGLKVRFVPYGAVPKVEVRLVTMTGNVDEQANEIWLADLTAKLLQQGTATRSAEDIAREAAMMGGSIDVTAGINQFIVGSDVFSESAPKAVALIADVIRHPRLPETELARLKADLTRNLAIEHSTPRALAQEKFLAVLYPNHAYGRYYPTEAMVAGYTVDQVRAFHERNFGAARSYLYVTGRFDQAAVEQAIRDSFGDWKAGAPPSPQNVTPVAKRGVYFIDRPGAVQSTITIGLPTINAANQEYLPLTVMNALLGGSFGSRITSNIREQKGYTYSPFSTVTTRVGAGAWAEVADVTTNVTGASIKEILAEIDRLRSEPPTADELQGIKNYVAGTFVLRNSSRSGINTQLVFLDMYGLSEDWLRTYVQQVYALTPADIQRIAQNYVDPAKIAIVVVGDKGQVLEQIKPYGTIQQ